MKGPIFTLLLPILLIVGGCKSEQAATKPIRGVPSDFTLHMQRSACMGRCPVYELQVEATGKVVYQGYMNVPLEGKFEKQLSAETMRSLLQAVEEADYFAFESVYDRQLADLPMVTMSVTREGKTHRVQAKSGIPAALRTLHNKVDELIGEDGFSPVKED